jgi:hypothetical protein
VSSKLGIAMEQLLASSEDDTKVEIDLLDLEGLAMPGSRMHMQLSSDFDNIPFLSMSTVRLRFRDLF